MPSEKPDDARLLSHFDAYVPVGYLAVGMRRALDVDRVTVNGLTVQNVVELNDVEGWAKFFGPNLEREGDHIRTFYSAGEVRVYWRNP
jgi:hypothetical protein